MNSVRGTGEKGIGHKDCSACTLWLVLALVEEKSRYWITKSSVFSIDIKSVDLDGYAKVSMLQHGFSTCSLLGVCTEKGVAARKRAPFKHQRCHCDCEIGQRINNLAAEESIRQHLETHMVACMRISPTTPSSFQSDVGSTAYS